MKRILNNIRDKYGSVRYYLRPFVTLLLLALGYFYLTIVFIWIVLKLLTFF